MIIYENSGFCFGLDEEGLYANNLKKLFSYDIYEMRTATNLTSDMMVIFDCKNQKIVDFLYGYNLLNLKNPGEFTIETNN